MVRKRSNPKESLMAINVKTTGSMAANGVKVLVYGQAGAGKTSLIKTLPSPIVLGDKLLICNDPGQCYLVKASPEKFEVLGTNVMPEMITSSPVVAEGALFIRTIGALYKIEKK